MQAFRERAMQRSSVPAPSVPQGGAGQPPPASTAGMAIPGVTKGEEQGLKQAQPDEATIIVKALIERLRRITPKPESPTPQLQR